MAFSLREPCVNRNRGLPPRVREVIPPIDPALSSVLKAIHAQMDARALAAPQKKCRSSN